MANVTKFPTSATTGSSPIAWSNINNIKADDGSVASVTLSSSQQSAIIVAGGFNFGISPLATIDGLIISMERYASLSNSIRDLVVRLSGSGGTFFLTDNQADLNYWSTTNGVVTFGSPSDLWGRVGGMSADIINNFEFYFVCDNNNYSSATAYIDYVKATVYYSIDGVKFSSSSLANIRAGSTQIQKIYHGSNQVFPDDEPNSIDWANVSGNTFPVTSSTQTFTGLNTSIPIRIIRSAGTGTTSYILNGGSPVAFTVLGTNILISNNDTLAFSYGNTKASSTSINVYHANKLNSSTNNLLLLDQLTLQRT